MSSAEFVCNPDANTTVYRWEATGVDELTRHNKLTSLPFWIPSATTRHHQFKLVLLRGLVPSADPANDAFGLIVELIPPPSPATEHGSAASSSSSSPRDFPGGCAVTCEVLPIDAIEGRGVTRGDQQQPSPQRSSHAKTLKSTKTAVVDGSNAQVSFPDLIPADLVKNARYVCGTPKYFTVQITIETGISVPLHQVATTAYSFFSSLSSSVTELLGTTTHLVHEGRENLSALLNQAAAVNGGNVQQGDSNLSKDKSAATGTAALADTAEVSALPPPWACPPEEWRSRPEAWRSLLCERLAGLDGTYRHGVEKTLSTIEVALLMEVGLSEADFWSLYALFNFDRDVQENLLTAAVVRARRYALVPAKLKEETFWANFFWKVHCVGQCVTERQVSAVIATLCTPSRAVEADMSGPVDGVLKVILDAGELTAVLDDFITRNEAGESWCSVVAEAARQCVAVLHVSAQRVDLSAHTRQQLSKALTELQDALSRYGASLATPPSTPAVVVADAADAAAVAAVGVDLMPPADLALYPAKEETEGKQQEGEVPPSIEGVSLPPLVEPTVVSGEKKEENEIGAEEPVQQTAPPPVSPPSPTALAPSAETTMAPAPRLDAGRSASRIEFTKMPWEEEDE